MCGFPKLSTYCGRDYELARKRLNCYFVYNSSTPPCYIQPGNVDVLPADRWSTSALGEVLSSRHVLHALGPLRAEPSGSASAGRTFGITGRDLHVQKAEPLLLYSK